MSDFSERERGFESKFSLDEEKRFKVASRAAHLFGLWVAAKLNLTGDEAETYAQKAVNRVALQAGHEGMLQTSEKDLRAQGQQVAKGELERAYQGMVETAQRQVGQ